MEESQKIVRTGVLILILIVAAAGVYYLFLAKRGGDDQAGRTAAAEAVKPKPAAAGGTAAGGGLDVPLDGSDALLREMAGDVSANPAFIRWLGAGGLIRRFVAAVDAIANGNSPRPQADFFVLARPFTAARRDGRTILDPASYGRYDVVADVLGSVSAAGCAQLYRSFQTQIRQAYRELGYPQGDFSRTLLKAVNELLRTPVAEGPLEVEAKMEIFVFRDERLEALSAAQKHLLRMGPENIQLIQAKLREMAAALGFAEADLAPPVRLSPGP